MGNKGFHNKPRHLRAIESIDAGLEQARQISIPDGIREGIKNGRLSQAEGEDCLRAYERASQGVGYIALAPELPPEPPDAA